MRSAMKILGSTGVYAYSTLISLIVCLPIALAMEGPVLLEGVNAAIAKVGQQQFYTSLVSVGLLYHLYNQARTAACLVSAVWLV